MCTVSMVGDFHGEYFPKRWPDYFPPGPPVQGPTVIGPFYPPPDKDIEAIRADMAAMRKELQEIKELLLRAKLYDEASGQPECAKDEKVARLRAVAEALGVDLSDVFPAP